MSRPMGVTKIGNMNTRAMGAFYSETPKAVFAALAYSLAHRLDGEEPDADAIINALGHEWLVLHQNGIVPQAPPARFWAPAGRRNQ